MDRQKQIEELAKEKNNKQWQRRDKYCLRIQKAIQYKGDCDHEDVPSILVDYESEIKKELIPENAVVLTMEEYERHKGFSREEVDEIIETAIKNSRKETVEKFADKVNTVINSCKKSVGMNDYVVDAERMIFEVNQICKNFINKENVK